MKIIHHINSIQTIDEKNEALETGIDVQNPTENSLHILDIFIKNTECDGDSQLVEHFPIHLHYWMSYAKKHDYDGISINNTFTYFEPAIDFLNKNQFYAYRNLSLLIFNSFTPLFKHESVIACFFTPIFHQLTQFIRVFKYFGWKYTKKHPSFEYDIKENALSYSLFGYQGSFLLSFDSGNIFIEDPNLSTEKTKITNNEEAYNFFDKAVKKVIKQQKIKTIFSPCTTFFDFVLDDFEIENEELRKKIYISFSQTYNLLEIEDKLAYFYKKQKEKERYFTHFQYENSPSLCLLTLLDHTFLFSLKEDQLLSFTSYPSEKKEQALIDFRAKTHQYIEQKIQKIKSVF